MPIYQTNRWICEICGKEIIVTEEVFPYSDPVVCSPNGEEWDYILDDKLACSNCIQKNQNLKIKKEINNGKN